MKERPILFSAPMVRALLDGRKRQTRRVVKGTALEWLHSGFTPEYVADPGNSLCPYGNPGDALWVRETWGLSAHFDNTDWLRDSVKGQSQDDLAEWKLRFAADYEGPTSCEYPYWRPSIFMPRWASRLTFEVTEVRIERLNDICENDAVAEGVEEVVDPERFWRWKNYMPERESSGALCSMPSARESFWSLWESINGTQSLAENPWVWVVGFKVVT